MANTSFSKTDNQALTLVADANLVFRWRQHASLLFSLGVGLLVNTINLEQI